MIFMGLAGGLCLVAALLAMRHAGRAAGSAARAGKAAAHANVWALRAQIADDDARTVLTTALTALGVPDVDAELRDRRVDVAERIRRDLVAAGITAQRINRTAAARARPTPPPSPHDDTWVKPHRTGAFAPDLPLAVTAERRRALTHRRRSRSPQEATMNDSSSTPPPPAVRHVRETPSPSRATATWSEVLVDLDGHLHTTLAKDCAHRRGVDACRVCCPHDDDVRVAAAEPADDVDDFSPLLVLVCAAAAFVVVSGIGYGALRLLAWIGGAR